VVDSTAPLKNICYAVVIVDPLGWRSPGKASFTLDCNWPFPNNRLIAYFRQNTSVDLWAFDLRGRAIDPVAVACGWSWLLTLLPPGLNDGNYPKQNSKPMVVLFSNQRIVHLVDAHEEPLSAVAEEESMQTGLTRAASSNATQSTASDRRQAAQNLPSTRRNANRTATSPGVLLASSQLVANALLALPNSQWLTRWVLGVADAARGGRTGNSWAHPGGANAKLPATLSDSGDKAPDPGQYRVQTMFVAGASTSSPETALVTINLAEANAGAWVRAWPLGFDPVTGERVRASGRACRADANGLARLTLVLPKGISSSKGLPGMDVQVLVRGPNPSAIAIQRLYGDLRFDRPSPAGGTRPPP